MTSVLDTTKNIPHATILTLGNKVYCIVFILTNLFQNQRHVSQTGNQTTTYDFIHFPLPTHLSLLPEF